MVLLFSSRDMELFRKRLSVYGSYCPSALDRLWVLSMVGLDKLIWVTVVGLAGTKGMESKGWKFVSLFKSWMGTKRRPLVISHNRPCQLLSLVYFLKGSHISIWVTCWELKIREERWVSSKARLWASAFQLGTFRQASVTFQAWANYSLGSSGTILSKAKSPK